MTIRPFSLGDVFLLQSLSRYATLLHIEQTLLQPQSPVWTALRASMLSMSGNISTHVLRQEENGLARAGFVQIEIRPNRPEADIRLLTPALDAPQGHPAIWQKLLSQASQQLVERNVTRLYCDLPNQPLPVSTLKQVGFHHYTSETVWRLRAPQFNWRIPGQESVREATEADRWSLIRLYEKVTPAGVQNAEGWPSLDREVTGGVNEPIILAQRPDHLAARLFVYEEQGRLRAALQFTWAERGVWLRLWANTNNPDNQPLHQLLRHALSVSEEMGISPIYIGVRNHQRGIAPLLTSYGFAPFTDRARMVRSIWQRIRQPEAARAMGLKEMAEALPGSILIPGLGLPGDRREIPPFGLDQDSKPLNGMQLTAQIPSTPDPMR